MDARVRAEHLLSKNLNALIESESSDRIFQQGRRATCVNVQVPQHGFVNTTDRQDASRRLVGKFRNRVPQTPEELRALPFHRTLDFMRPGAGSIVYKLRPIGVRPLRVAYVIGTALSVGADFISAAFK